MIDVAVAAVPEPAVNGPGDPVDWDAICWRAQESQVRRLRHRIFKAAQAGDLKQVRNLQKLMLRSRANALVSVRQVSQRNTGHRTAGVDGQVAVTSRARAELAGFLHRKGGPGQALPVRRVYVPKKLLSPGSADAPPGAAARPVKIVIFRSDADARRQRPAQCGSRVEPAGRDGSRHRGAYRRARRCPVGVLIPQGNTDTISGHSVPLDNGERAINRPHILGTRFARPLEHESRSVTIAYRRRRARSAVMDAVGCSVEQRVGLADQVVLQPGCWMQGASGLGDRRVVAGGAGDLAACRFPAGGSMPGCPVALLVRARC